MEHNAERIEVVHTDQAIAMNENPGEAIRKQTRASILRGALGGENETGGGREAGSDSSVPGGRVRRQLKPGGPG